MAGKGGAFSDEDYISSLEILSGDPPLGETLELLEVFLGPTLPEVVDDGLAHGPTFQECRLHGESCLWIGLPIKKWPGVKASMPSVEWLFTGPSGLEFRHASIWQVTVISSVRVKRRGPAIRFKWYLVDFTAASHSPPKWGACSGMVIQSILWVSK